MTQAGAQVRRMVAALTLAAAVGTVVHLATVSSGALPGLAFGLWVGSPLLAFGAAQALFVRRAQPGADGPGRLAGLWAAAGALLLVVVGSQVVVRTDRSSTAAILYVFVPPYAGALGTLAWLLGWGGGAWLARLARRRS